MSEKQEYGLLIPFKDQSEAFTLGFEAGMIYERMLNDTQFEQQVHSKNLDQIRDMAKIMRFTCTDDWNPSGPYPEWATVKLEKTLVRVK